MISAILVAEKYNSLLLWKFILNKIMFFHCRKVWTCLCAHMCVYVEVYLKISQQNIYLLLLFSISLSLKHHRESYLGRKVFVYFISHVWSQSTIKRTQYRNLKSGTEEKDKKRCCSLTCSSWLPKLFSYALPIPPT